MNIMAFGTGIRVELGYFNAGWLGMWPTLTPLSWRRPLQARQPGWRAVAVTRTEWEER